MESPPATRSEKPISPSLRRDRRQPNVVDLRIRAPHTAAGDAHLELAREVVELGVADELPVEFGDQRRSVIEFVAVNACQRTANDVAHVVAARTHRRQAASPQAFQHVREVFDLHPMELDVLSDCDIGGVAGVFLHHVGDGSQLVRQQTAARNANADHEVRKSLAFATRPADRAHSVSLGVHAPKTKVGAEPLRRNRLVPLAREGADFIQAFPRVFLALESLDPLGLGFLDFGAHRSPFPQKEKPTCQMEV